MSAAGVIGLLRSEHAGFATAMTWMPPAALRALTWDSGVENEPEALQSVASALDVDLAFAPADASWAVEAMGRLADANIARGWIVSGVLGRVAERRGWASVLRDSASQPGELAFALDEMLHAALEDVRTGIAAGAEVLLVADDLAGSAGWLVSPDFAMEALAPCYRRIVHEWAPSGRAAVFHSDGDVRALFAPLRHAGFDAVHLAPSTTQALKPAIDAARDAGLASMGGILASDLTQHGAQQSGVLPGELARSEGLIVADDGGITTAEQVAAFALALRQARRSAERH